MVLHVLTDGRQVVDDGDAQPAEVGSLTDTAELQQQLPLNMVLSIGYTRRQTNRNIGQRNTAVDPSTWTGPTPVIEVTAAGAGYAKEAAVTVWNRPSTASANLFFNSTLSNGTYNGADITVNKRMSNHFSLTGGATLGRTKLASQSGITLGTTADNNLNDPNVVNNPYFNDSIQSGDRPWSYRASGVVELPFQIQFSGTQVVQAGNTEVTTVQVTNQTITLAQGNMSVQVKPIGEVRYPRLLQTDLSLRKIFRFQNRSFTPRVDFFNAANNSTITSWVTQLGPNYHIPSAIQRGRVIKASVSTEF
jgi:hypothetical protein